MENRLDYADNMTGKKLTKKQLEVLLLLNPFVKKINYTEVGKILGVSRAAISARMCCLKKRCPTVYQKFKNLSKKLNDRKHRKKLDNPIPISCLCSEDEQNECFDYLKIKETF